MVIIAKTPIIIDDVIYDLLQPNMSISTIATVDGLNSNISIRFKPYRINENNDIEYTTDLDNEGNKIPTTKYDIVRIISDDDVYTNQIIDLIKNKL